MSGKYSDKATDKYLPTYLTVAEFATLKNVGRNTIYDHIAKGSIVPVVVGKKEHLYIDPALYTEISFGTYKGRPSKSKNDAKETV